MPHMAVPRSGDLWSGVLLAGFGVGFGVVARGYQLGSATRMGPGFFPLALAVALLLIGIAMAARSVRRAGPPVVGVALAPMVLVLGGTLLFAAVLQGAGLAAALVAVVLLSARASIHFRWSRAILLAGAVAALSVLVFVTALQLPVPVFGRWLTG
jgi:hypothetical protein